MKTCRKCRIEKPESEFYNNDHNTDGLHSYCKPCLHVVERDNRWKRDGQTGYKHILIEQPTNGTRICTKCRGQKPLSEFSPNGFNPKGEQKYRSLCKECSNAKLKDFHDRNPEKRKQYRLLKTYNMTPEFFDYMLKTQGGCAACGRPEPTGRGWSVDHDHACCKGEKSCGKCVRAILCMNCNNALGCVNDNVERLKKLIDYLGKFPKKPECPA